MGHLKFYKRSALGRLLAAVALLGLAGTADAAAPGIKGTTFNLDAHDAYITQPDGQNVYSWGYGCADTSTVTFAPSNMPNQNCSNMQIPGPTLIVTEGQTVTVNLPASAAGQNIQLRWNCGTDSSNSAASLRRPAAESARAIKSRASKFSGASFTARSHSFTASSGSRFTSWRSAQTSNVCAAS